jgi:uncharacterized protein YciI
VTVHALVLMATLTPQITDELQQEHEGFIDDLDREDRVVLGGGLSPAADPYIGAYVLRCASLEDARATAATDPLVAGGAVRCDVVEWQLVGVNPDAVDREALLYP